MLFEFFSVLGTFSLISGCTSTNPCGIGEGDCDLNNDFCEGNLICYKDGCDGNGKINCCYEPEPVDGRFT